MGKQFVFYFFLAQAGELGSSSAPPLLCLHSSPGLFYKLLYFETLSVTARASELLAKAGLRVPGPLGPELLNLICPIPGGREGRHTLVGCSLCE